MYHVKIKCNPEVENEIISKQPLQTLIEDVTEEFAVSY